MDRLGGQLLAGTGLAGDQHADLGVRHLPHHGSNLLYCRAGAHQTAKHIVITNAIKISEPIKILMKNRRLVQGIQ